MVGANSQRQLSLDEQLHQRGEGLLDARQFFGVLVVGVLANSKLLFIGKITRIDPDLVHPQGGFHGRIRFEMNVRHDRDIATDRIQLFFDIFKIGRVLHRGGGDSHHFTTHLDQIQSLLD